MAETKLCAKCGKNPATPKHAWCKACKAEYQRDYEDGRDERSQRRGFVAGVEAMRKTIAHSLAHRGGAMVRAFEVANWIMRLDRPTFEGNEPIQADEDLVAPGDDQTPAVTDTESEPEA